MLLWLMVGIMASVWANCELVMALYPKIATGLDAVLYHGGRVECSIAAVQCWSNVGDAHLQADMTVQRMQ